MLTNHLFLLKKKDENSLTAYSEAMKYFVIFSWLIFLGMTLYIDVFKFIIKHTYWNGLSVVPLVLISFIFQGIFFNLSVWYKLTDKTMYGAWFSLIGTIIIVVGNVLLVPRYSYMGSAWAAFGCYFVVMLVSYFIGQKHFPINYPAKDYRKILSAGTLAVFSGLVYRPALHSAQLVVPNHFTGHICLVHDTP